MNCPSFCFRTKTCWRSLCENIDNYRKSANSQQILHWSFLDAWFSRALPKSILFVLYSICIHSLPCTLAFFPPTPKLNWLPLLFTPRMMHRFLCPLPTSSCQHCSFSCLCVLFYWKIPAYSYVAALLGAWSPTVNELRASGRPQV